MDKFKLWEDFHERCPWYMDGNYCIGKVHYNQHVNDPRYGECDMNTCPTFFWVDILHP